jgi:hypothetical protein
MAKSSLIHDSGGPTVSSITVYIQSIFTLVSRSCNLSMACESCFLSVMWWVGITGYDDSRTHAL